MHIHLPPWVISKALLTHHHLVVGALLPSPTLAIHLTMPDINTDSPAAVLFSWTYAQNFHKLRQIAHAFSLLPPPVETAGEKLHLPVGLLPA